MRESFIDILEQEKSRESLIKRTLEQNSKLKVKLKLKVYATSCLSYDKQEDSVAKVGKGVWWMPRLWKATKDVVSCDKLRLGANDH